MYHEPVLLQECIEGLNINKDGVYVDVTFGGGGHSREIVKHLKSGRLIGFDQDTDALVNKLDDPHFTLVHSNFKFLKNFLRLHKVNQIDGLLADLGVSSHQFDTSDRGFSLRFEGALDMRMNREAKLSAKEVVNNYSEEELRRIFTLYGELDNAAKVARVLVAARKDAKIETTLQLKQALQPLVFKPKENKFFAQVFQALRIEVNQELEALKEMLKQSLEVLKPGGRLVVMSYHSLEDRLVKNFMRSGNFEGEIEKDFFGNHLVPFKLISRKAIIPTEEEINRNNRARSAKLRIAEKI